MAVIVASPRVHEKSGVTLLMFVCVVDTLLLLEKHARKIQPDKDGSKHALLRRMSPLSQRVVDIDMFIRNMQEYLPFYTTASPSNLFGFAHLTAGDIDWKRIAVELAHVVT